MENRFELVFGKAETSLAGYPFGEKTFTEQVSAQIDYEKHVTIVFPENIKMVASSFIQGFFDEIIKHIGFKSIDEKVTIESASEELSNKIKKYIR